MSANLVDEYFAINPFSASTQEKYCRSLMLLVAEFELDLAEMSAVQFRTWLDSHGGWGSSARWVAFCAVRGFLRWRFGAVHPALALRIRREESPPQRSLNLEQVGTLLQSFDTQTVIGRRDLAMAGIFLDSALRVSEVCRLQLRYLDAEKRTLRVIVKGGQWSFRTFSVYTAAWLSAWLADRVGVAKVDKVFVGIGGKTVGWGMTRDGVGANVRKWGKRAAIGILSPHDLRRSMGSISTILGGPEDIVMKGGGWHSESAFRRYTVGVNASHMEPYFPVRAAMESQG